MSRQIIDDKRLLIYPVIGAMVGAAMHRTDYVFLGLAIGFVIYIIFKVQEWSQEKQTRYIPPHVKNALLKRYFGKCAVCEETQLLEYHHRKQFADGGDNSEENIVPVCPKHHAMVSRLG